MQRNREDNQFDDTKHT